MSQNFAKFRNKEEELKRVAAVRNILGTSVDVAYGLPSGISLSVPGPIIDDAKRRSLDQLEWRVWYDIYKDRSYILVPYARRLDVRRIFTWTSTAFALCVVCICLRMVILYINKDKIMV